MGVVRKKMLMTRRLIRRVKFLASIAPLFVITYTDNFSVFAYGQTPPKSSDAQQAPPPIPRQGRTNVPTMSPDEVLQKIRQHLGTQFDAYLNDPKDYEQRVTRQCGIFPEGDLFSYIYPAMAYVNLALQNPKRKAHCVRQAQKLIDLAIPSVRKRFRLPDGKLENISNYQNHAVYLGQLNLALGAYGLISSDGRYDVLHKRVSDILHQALVKSQGRPLRSYPENSWPFDTIPVLVSLHLFDVKTSQHRSKNIIQQHLAWVRNNATHQRLRLPYSRVDNMTGKGKELPRGCDLSFRLCLIPHIDQTYARRLYKQYTRNYWLDRGILAGFAEWPNGIQHFADIDSGPIVNGIGLAATGLGLGATIAVGDRQRLQRLCEQLASLAAIRSFFVAGQQQSAGDARRNLGMIPVDDVPFTGFLFGDAMLFYCVTWQPWSKIEESKVGKSMKHDKRQITPSPSGLLH